MDNVAFGFHIDQLTIIEPPNCDAWGGTVDIPSPTKQGGYTLLIDFDGKKVQVLGSYTGVVQVELYMNAGDYGRGYAIVEDEETGAEFVISYSDDANRAWFEIGRVHYGDHSRKEVPEVEPQLAYPCEQSIALDCFLHNEPNDPAECGFCDTCKDNPKNA